MSEMYLRRQVFTEGKTTNEKIYKDSTTQAKVNFDLKYLRPK